MISFWSRLIDLISPRQCAICGCRLSITEKGICATCNRHLPRTWYQRNPHDNEMAKLYWILIPIEKTAALFFYKAQSEVSRTIYDLKYHHRPDIGITLGHIAAADFMQEGFFDDIDMIIPVPLTRKRLHHRGYNQSEMIARGVSDITGIKINTKVLKRKDFKETQTKKDRWERAINVEKAFCLKSDKGLKNKHILIIDDVVTTGATTIACARQLLKAGGVKISIMSLAFAKP
jgi:ComF family protein